MLIYGPWAETDPFAKTADNFCAQARYLVYVAFAILRRFHSVASLLCAGVVLDTFFLPD